MDYCVKNRTVFAVPTDVVDHFLKLASPDAVKVLLYVLRHGGTPLAGSEIAAELGIAEAQVEEAFLFWQQANILTTAQPTSGTPVHTAPEPPQPAPSPQATPKPTDAPQPFAQRSSAGFLPAPSELAARIEGEASVRTLFDLAERMFGRPVNPTEQRSLLWMRDYLGLETDVILMLLGYCGTIGKSHVRYVEAIAVRWQEEGITTLSAAQEEVQRLTERKTFTAEVMRITDMKRKPVAKQQELIDSWKSKAFSLELIAYAYEKTILAIDKPSFPYMNTILERWAADGLTDRAAVDAAEARKPAASGEHSYDLEEYKLLVNPF